MKMVLGYELYNFMFETARIAYENTYDMRGIRILHDRIRAVRHVESHGACFVSLSLPVFA